METIVVLVTSVTVIFVYFVPSMRSCQAIGSAKHKLRGAGVQAVFPSGAAATRKDMNQTRFEGLGLRVRSLRGVLVKGFAGVLGLVEMRKRDRPQQVMF